VQRVALSLILAASGSLGCDAELEPVYLWPYDAAPEAQTVDGLIAVEAEHYTSLSANGTPVSWTLVSIDSDAGVEPDPDPSHAATASGGAYLEALPDTFVTGPSESVPGTNFFDDPTSAPFASYEVRLAQPGRYYVWVRAYSTGGKDNTAHVGMDGQWPESGRRLQLAAVDTWAWSSNQRDAGGSLYGQPRTIWLDVADAGIHTILFAVREDGFELDKWVLTPDSEFVPEGFGPAEATGL
jgi:hypothetical protein